jgi:MYXO-CTERM domain-containing protein
MEPGSGCSKDSDCKPGNYCSSSEVCTPTLPLGGVCDRTSECQSEECIAGVCSTLVVSGSGVCAVRAPGSPDDTTYLELVGLGLAVAGASRRRRSKAHPMRVSRSSQSV